MHKWSMIILLVSFLIAANPAVYRATRGVLGSWIASPEGTAKLGGLVLHAIVFVALVKLAKHVVSPMHADRSMIHAADNKTHSVGGLNISDQTTADIAPASYM
jgi:hypothetical protein